MQFSLLVDFIISCENIIALACLATIRVELKKEPFQVRRGEGDIKKCFKCLKNEGGKWQCSYPFQHLNLTVQQVHHLSAHQVV